MLPSSFAKRLCSALPLNEDQRVLNEIKQATSLPLGSWDRDGERWIGAKESKP